MKKLTLAPPVLLVDDEPQILKSFSVMLRSSGIKDVATLDDGTRVLPFLEGNEVSAVVLDLSMPRVSGLDLLSEINDRHPLGFHFQCEAVNERIFKNAQRLPGAVHQCSVVDGKGVVNG